MTAQMRPTALQSVCCLECERTYSKPAGGGTMWANPGCPDCGYVGWMPAPAPSLPVEARAFHRSAERRPQVLVAVSR